MPYKNKVKMTEECLYSLLQTTTTPFEVILVDDNSTEKWTTDFPCVKYVKNLGSGVTDAWNYGAWLAKGEYICWANNDLVFTKDWEKPLMEALSNDVWITSPYHTTGDKIPDDFPAGKNRKNNMTGNNVGIPFLGSCFMMEKKNWERVGPIDDRVKLWCGDNYLYESVTYDFGRQCKEVYESYIHHFCTQTLNKATVFKDTEGDMRMFDKIYGERRWGDRPVDPSLSWCNEIIDLRLRLPIRGLTNKRVLNIGVGDMSSGIARQLVNLKFKDLEMVDVHKPYLQNAMTYNWMVKHIGFEVKDMKDIHNWREYDLVMVFDVFEHLKKEESIKIIKEIIGETNLIIFGPLEKEFRKNTYEVQSQDHLSLWTEQDFKDLGLKTEVLKNFHGDFDAVWASSY